MRAEGYALEIPPIIKSGQNVGPYPAGFEDRRIEHVFQASADFCLVHSLGEVATSNRPESSTVTHATSRNDAPAGGGAEEMSPSRPEQVSNEPVPAISTVANPAQALAQSAPAAMAVDLDERKDAYAAYKRKCKKAGVKMNEQKLAQLASKGWNTRDPVMKWKEGKDRPGDDALIRRAMQNVPTESP